jgi:hypothetical protein
MPPIIPSRDILPTLNILPSRDRKGAGQLAEPKAGKESSDS